MAEIHINTHIGTALGPNIPGPLGAIVKRHPDFDVPVVLMTLGRDQVRLWPATPEQLRGLATRLVACAEDIENEVSGG